MAQKPVQITVRGFELGAEAKDRILHHAEGLDHYDPRLTSCSVVCEAPPQHAKSGGQFKIRIEMAVPERTVSVTRQHSEDLNIAIRDAFDAARRELEDAVRKRDGRVKQHTVKLSPEA